MAPTRSELIEGLVEDLRPTRGPRRVGTLVALWLLVSWPLVVFITVGTAPLRQGWLGQLLTHPHFLLECLIGGIAGAAAITAAFRMAVPGPLPNRRRAAWALALLALWIGAYVFALFDPALDPSMYGKREGCAIQVMIYGIPPLVIGLLMLRRLAPLSRASTGALLGAAAGAIPALLMQVACMYVPEHILLFHIVPGLLVVLLGAGLGALLLRRI